MIKNSKNVSFSALMFLIFLLFLSVLFPNCSMGINSLKVIQNLSTERVSSSLIQGLSEFLTKKLSSSEEIDSTVLSLFLDTYEGIFLGGAYPSEKSAILSPLSLYTPDSKNFVYSISYLGQVFFRDPNTSKMLINTLNNLDYTKYSKCFVRDFLDIINAAKNSKDQRFMSLITSSKNHLYRKEESIAYMYKVWKRVVLNTPKEKLVNLFSILNYVGSNLNKLSIEYPNLGQVVSGKRILEVGAHRSKSYYTLGGVQYKEYADRFIENKNDFNDYLSFKGSVSKHGSGIMFSETNNSYYEKLLSNQQESLIQNIGAIISSDISTMIEYSSKFEVYIKYIEHKGSYIPLTATVVFDKPINDSGYQVLWVHTDSDYISRIIDIAQINLNKLIRNPKLSEQEKLKYISNIHYLMVEALPFMRGSALASDIVSKILSINYGLNIYKWNDNVYPDLEAITSHDMNTYSLRYPSLLNRNTELW